MVKVALILNFWVDFYGKMFAPKPRKIALFKNMPVLHMISSTSAQIEKLRKTSVVLLINPFLKKSNQYFTVLSFCIKNGKSPEYIIDTSWFASFAQSFTGVRRKRDRDETGTDNLIGYSFCQLLWSR